jgi:hypothetical protein
MFVESGVGGEGARRERRERRVGVGETFYGARYWWGVCAQREGECKREVRGGRERFFFRDEVLV